MTQELVKDWQYVVVAEVPAAFVIVYKIVFLWNWILLRDPRYGQYDASCW